MHSPVVYQVKLTSTFWLQILVYRIQLLDIRVEVKFINVDVNVDVDVIDETNVVSVGQGRPGAMSVGSVSVL